MSKPNVKLNEALKEQPKPAPEKGLVIASDVSKHKEEADKKASSKSSQVGKITPENVKRMKDVIGSYAPYAPDTMIEELVKRYTKDGKKVENAEDLGYMSEFIEAAAALGSKTHIHAVEAVAHEYRPFVFEMTRNLIQEYDCKTESEIALAETIASSYARYNQYSKVMTGSALVNTLTKPITQYYVMIGKELDRALRQFTHALFVLKQIKSSTPALNINVKTALIGQNQQINAFSNQDKPNEINERQ